MGTLTNFLTALHDGDYAAAAELYGGSYEVMVAHNPALDSGDHAGLLRAACLVNGAVCLLPQSVVPAHEAEGVAGGDSFQVSFMAEDGSRFELGSCCGETNGSAQTEFVFVVENQGEGQFRVVTPPVYVP